MTTAAAPAGPIDTRVEVVTPESIAFEYRIAGPFRRLPAYLIDKLVQMMLLAGCSIVLSLVAGTGMRGVSFGLMLTAWFAISWFYGGVFETLWNGQTPGKRAFKLRAISDNGQPLNAQQAVLRNLLRAVDMLPMAPPYLFGLLAASSNDRFQRLGDLACGTMVIVEEPHLFRGLTEVQEPEVQRISRLLPPRVALDPQTARALSVYVSNRKRISASRRAEIARHLAEPWRLRLGLPPATPYDALLCALYAHNFLSDSQARA